MNSKVLMSASALFMATLGVGTSFAPQELLSYAGVQPVPATVLLVQVTGALYMGFAMLNWMARGHTIGGIYSRPIVAGNLLHFFVVAILLLKAVAAGPGTPALIAGALVYALGAAGFGHAMFTPPKQPGISRN